MTYVKEKDSKIRDMELELYDYIKAGSEKDADKAVIKAFSRALDLEEEEPHDDWPWKTKWI